MSNNAQTISNIFASFHLSVSKYVVNVAYMCQWGKKKLFFR